VLAFTAARMIVTEPLLDAVFDPPELLHTLARWSTYGAAIAGVLGAGWWHSHRRPAVAPHAAADASAWAAAPSRPQPGPKGEIMDTLIAYLR
jgi:hypothetical protein